MGFFSFTSALTGNDIANKYTSAHDGIAMILPDNRVIKGDYDGYGRIETSDGRVMDIHGIEAAILNDKDPFELSDETLDEMRDEGLRSYFGRKNDGGYNFELHHIKVVTLTELESVEINKLDYDDLDLSIDAESQGYFGVSAQ